MRVIYPLLVFAGLILLILPVAVPYIKTSAEFSMFNTGWDGCSSFAKMLFEKGEVFPVLYPYDSVKLSDLNGVLVVVGPNIDFSSIEVEEVRKFLENGGTLFIADDFGTGNTLLEKLGVKARFSSKPLKDIFYSKRAEFPVVVRIEDPVLARDVEKIVLNVPTVIVNAKGEVFTSKVSVVGETMKSYPILAEVKYGEGRIVMLSDPSILINDMFEENKQFIKNLAGYLGNTFYFDEAHHLDFNPYAVATVYIHKEFDKRKAFQVFTAVAVLAILIESGVVVKILKFTAKLIPNLIPKREENLLENLPEWVDRDVLEKILNEIKTGSKLGDIHGREGVYRKAERRG